MTTMTEIASRLGVSGSTVSYALSGKRTASEETRRGALAETERAKFQPNAAGRALATRRSRAIAFLYPAGNHGLTTTPLEFVISADETGSRFGYAVVVAASPLFMAAIWRCRAMFQLLPSLHQGLRTSWFHLSPLLIFQQRRWRVSGWSPIALLEGKIGRQSQSCLRAQVTIRRSTGPVASSEVQGSRANGVVGRRS